MSPCGVHVIYFVTSGSFIQLANASPASPSSHGRRMSRFVCSSVVPLCSICCMPLLRKIPPAQSASGITHARSYFLFSSLRSHFWFATPQDVLHADWQEVWHSPQPPFAALFLRSRVSIVCIRFIEVTPSRKISVYLYYTIFRIKSSTRENFLQNGNTLGQSSRCRVQLHAGRQDSGDIPAYDLARHDERYSRRIRPHIFG